MALGITKSDTMTKWEIPLMQDNLPPDNINDWDDNSWIHEKELKEITVDEWRKGNEGYV